MALGLTVWAIVPVWSTPAPALAAQPYPDSQEYASEAQQIAEGHGLVTRINERDGQSSVNETLTGKDFSREFPPRYPPGTSLALSPFALIFGHFPHNVQLGERFISTVYIVAVVLAAWLIGGPCAAAFAATFVLTSPFARSAAIRILSDELSAVLTVLTLIAILCATKRARVSWLSAGVISGLLFVVRLTGVIGLAGAGIAALRRAKTIPESLRFVGLVALGAAPLIVALGIWQWHAFGSPLRTGYSYWLPGLKNFAVSYISHPLSREGPFIYPDKLNGELLSGLCPCGVGGSMTALPNYTFYPLTTLGAFWVFAPPGSAVVALLEMYRRRRSPAVWYAAVTVVLSNVLLIPYFYQAARFLAPASTLLLIYGATGLSGFTEYVAGRVAPHFRALRASIR